MYSSYPFLIFLYNVAVVGFLTWWSLLSKSGFRSWYKFLLVTESTASPNCSSDQEMSRIIRGYICAIDSRSVPCHSIFFWFFLLQNISVSVSCRVHCVCIDDVRAAFLCYSSDSHQLLQLPRCSLLSHGLRGMFTSIGLLHCWHLDELLYIVLSYPCGTVLWNGAVCLSLWVSSSGL